MKTIRTKFVLICALFGIFTLPAYALTQHNFNMNLPKSPTSTIYGPSYASSGLTGETPYVTTNVTTILTTYYLAPYGSTTKATWATNLSTLGTGSMSWKTGYGGAGGYYRLAAAPHAINGTWNAYNVSGVFGF